MRPPDRESGVNPGSIWDQHRVAGKRFRWATPIRKGRWHPTRRAAGDAAIAAGLASRDPYSGNLYLDVLTRIEERDARP